MAEYRPIIRSPSVLARFRVFSAAAVPVQRIDVFTTGWPRALGPPKRTMFAPSTQPALVPFVEQGAQFHGGGAEGSSRSASCFPDYFTNPWSCLFGSSLHHRHRRRRWWQMLNRIWIAKRSLPTWAMIVEIPGYSSGGFGNGNTLFLWFFITTVMPRVQSNSKSPYYW